MLPPGRNGTASWAHPGQQQRQRQQQRLAAGGPPRGSAWPGPGPVVTAGLLSLLVVWALLGNLLVCAAVVRSRPLRARVTHVFIASLAASDLLVALLVMPWKAVAEVAGYWPFGAFCDVWVAFDIMCSTASILNLCLISLDRYWAISRPFRYERAMTPRVAGALVGLAWALAVLISFVPVQLNWHRGQAGSGAGPDLPPNGTTPWAGAGEPSGGAGARDCDSSLNRAYAISSSLVSFYIPVAVMLVTYAHIYRIAQAQARRIASLERAAGRARGLGPALQKETKVLKTLAVILGVFVGCWLPFFVLNCMVPFCNRRRPPGGGRAPGLPCVSETTFDVFVWFGWANSSLNPVIYAFNADFRKVFAQLLGCGRLCARTRVETVRIGSQRLSHRGDAGCPPGETAAASVHPNAVAPGDREVDSEEGEGEEGEEGEGEEQSPFHHESQMAQRSPEGQPVAESVWELDCEGEIPGGKRTPRTPNGFHQTA
ncbi:D(1B) dopamine receptor [Perognathus longimembris pacificus]|uniref:D(1B) dopamine receptor n=1 Tax=Perognathus longimembris pacificus TaxID=214514 RepID=UPI0020195475|nr:D(1B) dopamine receptor [Perognathus longimembris pacificus]